MAFRAVLRWTSGEIGVQFNTRPAPTKVKTAVAELSGKVWSEPTAKVPKIAVLARRTKIAADTLGSMLPLGG